MKKLSAVLAMLLAVCMLFVACGGAASDQEKLVGDWKATIEMGTLMEQLMAADPTTAEMFDLSGLTMSFTMTFDKKGVASITMSEAEAQKLVDDVLVLLEDGLKKYMGELAGELGMSLDDMLAASGMTMELLMEQLENEINVDEMLSDLNLEGSGQYLAKDGKLFISEDADTPVDENGEYVEYRFEGSKLILEQGTMEEDAAILFPMTLVKK